MQEEITRKIEMTLSAAVGRRLFAVVVLVLITASRPPTARAVEPDSLPSKVLFLTSERDIALARYELLMREKEEIFSVFYLWDGVRAGAAAMALHRDAALRGVKVRIIIDGMSSLQMNGAPPFVKNLLAPVAPTASVTTAMMRALQEDGVEIRIFNPLRLSSLYSLVPPVVNTRAHDKVGFFKSQNIAHIGDKNYQSLNFRLAKYRKESYRSVEAYFQGEETASLNSYLMSLWDNEDWVKKPNLAHVKSSDVVAERQKLKKLSAITQTILKLPQETLSEKMIPTESLKFVHDVPGEKRKVPGMEIDLLKQIRSANHRLVFVSPYITLTPAFKKEIYARSADGVKITIVTPSLRTTDAPIAGAAFEAQAKELREHGITIFHHQGPDFLHAKMLLVDDDHTIITSHNFDFISQFLNYESGLIVSGKTFNAKVSEFVNQLIQDESLPYSVQKNSVVNRCFGLLLKVVTEHPPFKSFSPEDVL